MRRVNSLACATLLVALVVLGSPSDPAARAEDLKELSTLEGHKHKIRGLTFTPNGKKLLSCAGEGKEEGEVKIWDVATGKEAANVEIKSGVLCVAVAADGKTWSLGMEGNAALSLWDVGTAKVSKRLDKASFFSPVTCMAFSADGKALAAVSAGEVVAWDVGTTRRRFANNIGGIGGDILGLSWSRDGKTLAVANGDKEVPLLDATSGKKLASLAGHEKVVTSIAFSPDGRTLASGSADQTVRLWDVAKKNTVRSLEGHSAIVLAVAYAPDGKTLASADLDGAVRFWNMATGKEVALFEPKGGFNPRVLVFSPDGKTLAMARTKDKTIILYDVEAITKPKK